MKRFLLHITRSVSLILLTVLGTAALVYAAPGYFSDVREMDAAHAELATQELARLHGQQGTLWSLLHEECHELLKGHLGSSRQLERPVVTLLNESLPVSANLLLVSVALGWSLALLLGLLLSLPAARSLDALLAMVTASLFAVPIGALATLCLLANHDAPVLVLALVVGARDFKLLHKIFQNSWRSSYLLYARAQGFTTPRIIFAHIIPSLRRELISVAVMSLTLALSALIPVEVIFDRAGVGKLAWNAAMNRDLPVLVATTALVGLCVSSANALTSLVSRDREQLCVQ